MSGRILDVEPMTLYSAFALDPDDASPDAISRTITATIRALEDRGEAEMIPLNWTTLRIEVQERIDIFRENDHVLVRATIKALDDQS